MSTINTINTIKAIETSFSTVKQVGSDGVALTQLTVKTIENMKQVVLMFEEGMKSNTWSSNMQNFAGDEGMVLAMQVYETFKATLTTLGEYP